MGSIRERMEQLLGEKEVDAEETAGEDVLEPDFKHLVPQLILAMQSQGMDPSNEEHIDAFLKMLKLVATTKSSMFKTALKRWAPSKAMRAVKAAKLSI